MSAALSAVPNASSPVAVSERRAAVVVKQIIVRQMMTIEEVCAWLNKEEGAIRQQVARARSGTSPNPIPFYQPGGKGCDLRFDYSEIVKWARGGKEEVESAPLLPADVHLNYDPSRLQVAATRKEAK